MILDWFFLKYGGKTNPAEKTTLKITSPIRVKETFSSGATLTSNEIRNIMKVNKSLENRGILIKETTGKITSQKGGFLPAGKYWSPLCHKDVPFQLLQEVP